MADTNVRLQQHLARVQWKHEAALSASAESSLPAHKGGEELPPAAAARGRAAGA